jgi:hypothetical protein
VAQRIAWHNDAFSPVEAFRSGDCDGSVAKNVVDFAYLILPVGISSGRDMSILHHAQGVDPKVPETDTSCNLDGVLQQFRQILDVDLL